MSRNGELCLQKVIFTYSPSHGNPSLRQFLHTYLPLFQQRYPSVTIDLRPRHWPETSITGVYRDGSERAYTIRYLSSLGIHSRVHRLLQDANDTNDPFSAAHLHAQRRSVQGPWNPFLWQYESRRRRAPPAAWDRRLTPEEWNYQVRQYTAEMHAEEEAIAGQVRRYTDLPDQSTTEVQRRWRTAVWPSLQSDLEYNLSELKRRGGNTEGGKKGTVSLSAYRLFSVPDHTVLAQDAVEVLRRREAQREGEWWAQRREQRKPPL